MAKIATPLKNVAKGQFFVVKLKEGDPLYAFERALRIGYEDEAIAVTKALNAGMAEENYAWESDRYREARAATWYVAKRALPVEWGEVAP